MRDPKIDPQPGDRLRKQMASNNWSERLVTRREDNDIFYTSRKDGPERRCWISSWMEWTREAEVVA